MYTLEKHLQNSTTESDQFELLNSIWTLNKRFIPNAQSAISFNFPHYSLHEKSHSETIIKNIESFLGEERIKQLSPTDTWLILMAAYTHDLGMVVFQTALEKKWIEDDFQSYLNKLCTSNDNDLKNAADLLLRIQKKADIGNIENTSNLPLEIRKSVILITADFFRKNHHLRSKQVISGMDEEFSKLVNGFNLSGIPNRFTHTLADIAFSHGTDFYSVLERLEYIADGFGNDKMHPRFIAYLLRLGDLLDIDDKRFNIFNYKVLSDELPHTSHLHSEKHAAVKHLLISPKSIEVTVDCKSDEVYRVAREWFDWLQKEVQDQSKEWANIAPDNLWGMPPTISKGKIKVLYRSVEPREELMNLRFAISNQKVFEMFEGSAIYENAEFVFIREIVQNAIDASKIQLWRIINSGVYDYAIRKHLDLDETIVHDDIIKCICFPTDIPEEIWENFQINLKVFWKNKDKSVLRIQVEDNGTGISEKNLIRMTQKVGESRSNDEEYLKFKESMPYWLQPTGAFGIGLQSIFLVTKQFIVQTKAESEEPREIIFTSSKNNEYSRITENIPNIHRGSILSIDIPQYKFSEIFSNSYSYNLVENFDYFTDTYGDIHLHKLEEYIKEELKHIENINIHFLGNQIKSSKNVSEKSNVLKNSLGVIRLNNLMVYQLKNNDDYPFKHTCFVLENCGIGSILTIYFNSFFNPPQRQPHLIYRSTYLIRDIPIKEESVPNFFLTRYCAFVLNFQSTESDKLLNISRDKFIRKTKNKFENEFLKNIFPKIVENYLNIFEEAIPRATINDDDAIEYFHIELTATMSKIKCNHLDSIYKEYQIPEHLVVDNKLMRIKPSIFFSAYKILIINKRREDGNENREETKNIYKEVVEKEKLDFDVLLTNEDYFIPYLLLGEYSLTKHLTFKDSNGEIVIASILENKTANTYVVCNELSEKVLLKNFLPTRESNRRRTMIPLQKYANLLAVKGNFDGFHRNIRFTDHSIISPFKNLQEYLDLKNSLNDSILAKDTLAIKNTIKHSYIEKLVPKTLLNWIKEHSSNQDNNINNDIILDTYTNLILDLLFLTPEDIPNIVF